MSNTIGWGIGIGLYRGVTENWYWVLGIVKAFVQNWYCYWVLLKPFSKTCIGIGYC